MPTNTNKKQSKKPENNETVGQKPQTGPKPEILSAAATTTAKIKGKREATLAGGKAKRANLMATLRNSISVVSVTDLKFSSEDKSKLAKALNTPVLNTQRDELIRKKLASLTTSDLEAAEDAEHGTGARLFAFLTETKNGKQILKQTPYNYKFKQEDKLSINFQNQEQENNYGMRTLFKHQPEIREVKITQKGPRGAGREGIAKRSSLNGDFYFADGSYAPIFNKTDIEIVKVFTQAELEEYKKKPPAPVAKYKIPKTKPRQNLAAAPLPTNEIMDKFHLEFQEIMQMSDPQKLIDMRDKISLRANDPIVKIPGENKRIRSGAALRYALFKRFAQLKGYRVEVSSGYRSEQHQKRLWDKGLEKRTRIMRGRYPNASEAEIRSKAISLNSRFVAPPGKSHHNTGGAIDIRVFNPSGVKISGLKFRGSKRAHKEAMESNFGSLVGGYKKDNIAAIRALRELNDDLMASYFLGKNYHREVWHWNVDRKETYKKIKA